MNSMIASPTTIRPSLPLARGAFATALAVVSLTLGGCFFLKSPTPDLRIVSAQLVERTADGVVINVEIEGANRTAKDMKLRSIHYWMDLNGERVFESERTPQATFPALGVQSFTVPVAAPRVALPAGDPATYHFGAKLQYLVPGPLADAMYDLNVRKPNVHITATGQIDLHAESAPESTPPSTSN
jgi:hypothetical protein